MLSCKRRATILEASGTTSTSSTTLLLVAGGGGAGAGAEPTSWPRSNGAPDFCGPAHGAPLSRPWSKAFLVEQCTAEQRSKVGVQRPCCAATRHRQRREHGTLFKIEAILDRCSLVELRPWLAKGLFSKQAADFPCHAPSCWYRARLTKVPDSGLRPRRPVLKTPGGFVPAEVANACR